MSAWKYPSRSAWFRKSCSTRVASTRRSSPSASMAALSDIETPSAQPSVITDRPDRNQTGLGTGSPHRPSVFAANSDAARAFQPQVQLAHHHAFEMRDHVHRAQAARRGREHLDHPGGKVEGVDILAERAFDVRAQNLDGHLLARLGQPRPVDLRDRGSGNRLGEFGKGLIDRNLQLCLDHLLGDRRSERAAACPADTSAATPARRPPHRAAWTGSART